MGRRDDRTKWTRQTIADTALDLFLAKGYEETTFDEIADKAGVSRSTVFRYFPEKEELPFARDVEHLRVLQTLLRADETDLEDRTALHRVMVEFARHLEADETLQRRARLVSNVPRLYARSVTIRTAWEELVARDLAGGRRPDLQRRVVAATVVGALYSAVGEWQAKGGSLVLLVKRALGYTDATAR